METIIKIFASIISLISMPSVNVHDIYIKLSSKEGLYKDSYEDRYVYKGRNPDNYIVFNNELWRILSFENDGTIKIIKNESIGKMVFDKKKTNNWATASLNTYLNDKYYKHLNIDYKAFMVKHNFNIGGVYKSGNLNVTKNEEYQEKWYGYIGLMTISDFLDISHDKCPNLDIYLENYETCNQNNYISLILKNKSSWTLSKDMSLKNNIFYVGSTYFPDVNTYEYSFDVLPVIYLNKKVKLIGNGSIENPYMIKRSS